MIVLMIRGNDRYQPTVRPILHKPDMLLPDQPGSNYYNFQGTHGNASLFEMTNRKIM